MDHIAIDLGGKKSQVCRREADGKIVEEGVWATDSLANYLKKQAKSRVIVETCAEGFAIADAALLAGHEVRVVPATMVRTLGVGARRTKTDKKDAQVLSEVSCRIDLPSVHVPSHQSRELKSMSAAREVLVESRTKLVNNVRGWLRRFVSKLPSGDTSTFAQRVRRHKKEIPNYIERVLRAVEALSTQIEEADKELLKVATDNQAIARLMTMPGVGPVTAVRFFSALDEVNRFHNAHAVESYLGIVPGEDSSSERKRITSITKAGSTKVRWTLIQAAWVAWRCKPTAPMSLWATRVAERRGRRVAVTALARKMAGILYAMWRDEKDYDNNHQPNPQSQNGWERLEAHLAN